MADKTIAALPAAGAALFTNFLEIDNGASRKLTSQQLWDLFRQGAQLLNGASITVDAANLRLNDSDGDVVANWGTRTVYDDTGDVTVDWGNRFLVDDIGENAVEWDDRFLVDANGTNSVEWGNRFLLDTGAIQSVDWVGRKLLDNVEGDMLNWTTPKSLIVTQGILVHGTGFTVATLPAAGTVGRKAYVTDALAPTFGSAVVGTGAVKIPVFDNGTAWIVA